MKAECPKYPVDLLADLAAGRLTEAEAGPVRDHVARCDACRRAMNRAEELERQLRAAPRMADQSVSQVEHARIMQAARQMLTAQNRQRKRQKWQRVLAGLAAAILLAIAGPPLLRWLDNISQPSGQQVTTVAVLQQVEGPVTIGDEQLQQGGVTILSGRRIETGAGGRASLRLSSGGLLEMNERTVLLINDLPADQASSGGRRGGAISGSRINVEHGEVYVSTRAGAESLRVEVLTGGGMIIAGPEAELNVRVAPLELADGSTRWPLRRRGGVVTGGGLFSLPLAVTPLVELPTATARIELTVLDGQVRFEPYGQAAVELAANQHLVFDPIAETTLLQQAVRTERFVLWRMDTAELLRLAEPLLPRLLAGRGRILDDGRLELRYDWSLPQHLNDWQMSGIEQSQAELSGGALRLRDVSGEQVARLQHAVNFGGDIEISYSLTADQRQDWRAGFALAAVTDDGASAAPADDDALQLSAAVRQQAQAAEAEIISYINGEDQGLQRNSVSRVPDSSVHFGAVDQAISLRLGHRTLAARQLPSNHLELISAAAKGRGNRLALYLELQGQDVFLDDVTIRGRPDPRWLRRALNDFLQHSEQSEN